jgi:molybdate transport system regulatory protein
MLEENNQYQLNGRIWIEIGNKALIGEGKANLLKRTAVLGSLRKASLEQGLSYRQAWYSLSRLNKATGEPLILLQRGGKNGGIARITEYGERILNLFEKSQCEFEIFLNNQTTILNT